MTRLTVIAGPTAVGKGTVVAHILRTHPEIKLSVSATTRSPRPGEQDGIDYHFWTADRFAKSVEAGEMLEYATVHGSNSYGTPRALVEASLQAGQPLILEIDIQGARQVKKVMPEANLIFIAPPSWEELVRRLQSRGTEGSEEQARRLETAEMELAAQTEFDHIVINDEVARCAEEVVNLMQS